MRSYKFFDQLLVRVPRFPKEALNQSLQFLLNDPVFRDAIYLASDALYEELRKRDFRLSDGDEKLTAALKKYHHRICYRSTPFGGFASVSQTQWGSTESEQGLIIQKDSFKVSVLIPAVPEIDLPKEELYYSNPALYAYGTNFRLYEGIERDEQAGRIFKMNELMGEGLPEDLILDKRRFTYDDIIKRLASYGLNSVEADDFITDLLETQVLIKVVEVSPYQTKSLSPAKLRDGKGAGLYAHTSHKTKGTVDIRIQKDIYDGIYCLEHLTTSEIGTNSLDQFKERFISLFDRQEVPLLLALDPEAGIDYGSNAAWNRDSERTPFHTQKKTSWTKVHEVLLSKWTMHKGAGLPSISLNEDDLRVLKQGRREHSAPGMMAMFSMIPGGIHLHAAGGLSALNILGRFTQFDDELLKMASEISQSEQAANPAVVFAEVLHDSDELADKLNLRPNFRDYVIPVLTRSGIEADQCIELNDLFLSVVGGKLILRSSRLDKRVIPRLSTAYNHRRNTLSVYRFLCDLQNEDSSPSLNFSLSGLFPGLPFYPAVYYGNVLLEAASWYIDGDIFKSLIKLEPERSINAFKELAGQLELPAVFMYEQHDQRLLVRREYPQDIRLLFDVVKTQSLVCLREYHDDRDGLVTDENGQAFGHEFIAFLLNTDSVYEGHNNQPAIFKENPMTILEDWLYLKVYLHPCGMDSFLQSNVMPFIDRCKEQCLTDQWFFIRYYDTDDHLRIRIKYRKGYESLLLEGLQSFLLTIKLLPNVRAVQMASYEKELERFAPIGIDVAEHLFCLSTELVMNTISEINKNSTKLPIAIQNRLLFSPFDHLIAGVQYLHSAFEAAGFEAGEVVNLSKNVYNRLFNQLKIGKELRVAFDRDYRSVSVQLNNQLKNLSADSYTVQYFNALEMKLHPLNQYDRYKVLVDLNHLHLNRLFADEPNANEAQCYYYLYKQLLRQVKAGRVRAV